MPEGYVFDLKLRLCLNMTLCGQRSSYVCQPVSYSPTFPHPNKTLHTICRYFRQSVGVQSLAWWLVFKFRTLLVWLGLCILQSFLVSCGSELRLFIYFCFWTSRNIAQVFCVVELSAAVSADYFDVKCGNFVLVCVLLASELWVLFIVIFNLLYHNLFNCYSFNSCFFSSVTSSEILPLQLPPSSPCSSWVNFVLWIAYSWQIGKFGALRSKYY